MLPALWLLALHSALAGLPVPPRTVFSGHLANAPAGDTVRLWVGQKRAKTALSPSGDFRFEFDDLAATTPVNFSYARQSTRLYLLPGDQLHLTLDFKDFDKSLVYSGRGAEANNYMAQSLWKFEFGPAGDVPRPKDQLTPTTTPAEMRRYADAFRQQRLAFLAAYAKAHPLPAGFRHDAEFIINMQWGRQLLEYVSYYHAQKPADASAAPAPVVSEAYFSFLKELPLKELDQHFRGLDENTLVAWFLNAYQNRLAPSGKLSRDPAEGPQLYQRATLELGNIKARNMAMQALLYTKLNDDPAGGMAFYPTFRAHNADSTVARNLRKYIAQRQQLAVGKPAPTFTLLDNTGKQVSLSDFKGKVVYLDFWGTWCAPCMKEMTESAPALKKKFEGRDVVFLYIAVGDAEAKWRQTLAEKQFTSPNSVHLRSAADTEATAYQVNGYPSYYLIDREGRFVQLYASRPSDGDKTVAAIEQALAR